MTVTQKCGVQPVGWQVIVGYNVHESSGQCVREQARHLLDEEKLRLTSPRFGKLAGRFVLYLGENLDTKDGIAYRNAEQFLKSLPEITLVSGLEEMPADFYAFEK